MVEFSVRCTDLGGRARRGALKTPRGTIETPCFIPVGSLGAVKGIGPDDLQALGYGLILNNAYHLYLRPGHEVVAQLGGLHAFTGWPGAILTDSGGFQVFSLAKLCRVTDDGVTFSSHIDGSSHHITPERAIEIQEALGADIIMAFDECVALPAPRERVRGATLRTNAWARRCQDARQRTDQALFGIVQGGTDPDLRVQAARDLVSLGFDGYAIGGLSVGEEALVRHHIVEATVPELPAERPRYLMGVGMPEDRAQQLVGPIGVAAGHVVLNQGSEIGWRRCEGPVGSVGERAKRQQEARGGRSDKVDP